MKYPAFARNSLRSSSNSPPSASSSNNMESSPRMDGTFPPPGTYNYPERRRGPHVRIPALVHPFRPVLAPRPASSRCVPVHLVALAPVPHHWRCCPWRAGDHLPRHHTSFPPAGGPVSHLRRWIFELRFRAAATTAFPAPASRV